MTFLNMDLWRLTAARIEHPHNAFGTPALPSAECRDCNTSTGSYRRPLFGPRNALWRPRCVFHVQFAVVIIPSRATAF
jgi:hypothetical protein